MNSVVLKVGFLTLMIYACAFPKHSFGKIVTGGNTGELNIARKEIVILNIADALPGNAIKIDGVELDGKTDAESYRSLIASARLLAARSDANIIKITELGIDKPHSREKKVKVSFYKSEYARKFEKEFAWSADRLLTWDDFRGPDQPEMGEDVAAATFCGIGFETNTISSLKPDLKVYVYNTFYPAKSWVKDGLEKPEILAHEQCHFDICELYTRKLRAKMSDVTVSVADMKTKLKKLYADVQQEYVARQERYEQETEHGIVPEEQARWQKMIAAELNTTSEWME